MRWCVAMPVFSRCFSKALIVLLSVSFSFPHPKKGCWTRGVDGSAAPRSRAASAGVVTWKNPTYSRYLMLDPTNKPHWCPSRAPSSVCVQSPPSFLPFIVLASEGEREDNGPSCAELAFKMLLRDARSSAACHKLFIFSIIHAMSSFISDPF